MPKTLNIAVIGAGTMAQAVHLPVLRRRWDRFAIAALVDHSPRRRRESSEIWGIEEDKRYESVADLVAAVRAKTLSLVDLALGGGEGARDGQGARDIGGVQGVDLDPGVDQHQLVPAHHAVVADPVQGAGVIARGGDRVVADPVAVGARGGREDALDDALAAGMAHGARQLADDVLEAAQGRLDRLAHLAHLVLVLEQALLAGSLLQGGVLGGGLVPAGQAVLRADLLDHRLDARVHARHDAQRQLRADVLGQVVAQLVDVPHLDAQALGGLGEGRATAHPHLAVAGIGVELAGVEARPGTEEVRRLRGARLLGGGLDHEHAVGLLIGAQSRVVREGGVRAEGVVGVVRAHLEHTGRQHQTGGGKTAHERVAARGRPARGLERSGVRDGLVPAGGDELAEGLVAGPLRAGVAARGEVLHPVGAGGAVGVTDVLGVHTTMLSWRGLPWTYE